MTDNSDDGSAARAGVAHTASAEPGRIRRCSATAVLALLSAAAFAPLLAGGASGLGTALLGVAGNIGGGLLTGVIGTATERLRDGKHDPSNADALRDEIAVGLLTALERGDAAAQELRIGLTDLLMRIGGVAAAIDATGDDVRSHLRACFGELAGQQDEAIRQLQALDVRQRRQERRLGEQTRLIEEMADRLRLLTGLLTERRPGAEQNPGRRAGGAAAVFQLVAPSAPLAADGSWRGGAQLVVDECVYLLHDDFLEERFSADRSTLFRQARALRIAPAPARGQEYAWLRQVETRQPGPAAYAALAALGRERDLLARLRVEGMPRALQLTADNTTATLAMEWPGSSFPGGPCETLAAGLGQAGAPPDSWLMFRLFTGLAGLCITLGSLHKAGVAHRYLTPAGIIVLDDGRLVLRDAGLAGREHRPGEGPADYQAPEQRRGAAGRPGALTDSYQLAAVAYHLLVGHPPHPRIPLPLHAQVPEVPGGVSAGIAAALASDPAKRPDIRSLAEAFHAARDDLS
jgi:hypothetical protein